MRSIVWRYREAIAVILRSAAGRCRALEDDPWCVAEASRPVLDIAGAMLGGVLVLVEAPQVPEDLAGARVALAVLGLQCGDLQLSLALLRVRLHLPRDEVEQELGQPLANGRRVRAPLRLVQRQHPSSSSRSSENNTASCH